MGEQTLVKQQESGSIPANGDECYVSVVADEANGVPAGWVHNRQVVVGTKLGGGRR